MTAIRPAARCEPEQLIVGTYTEQLPFVNGMAAGILACSYQDGKVGRPRLLASSRNPSWLTITNSGRTLYAVQETTVFDGQASGGIVAYARDPRTGSLRELGGRSSAGTAPAHAAWHEPFLLVANYESGSVASFAVDEHGGLSDLAGFAQHTGSSVDPNRQTGPHAHMVCVDPVTGRVLVPDLGLDAVLSYEVGERGELIEHPEARITVRPGAGPRHLAFHPTGQYLYLLNEIDSTLVALHRDGTGFIVTGTHSTLPASCTVHSEASAVRVAASGRFVFASNRGYDSIAVFALDESSGALSLERVTPTPGREPRDFCQARDGEYLLVAHQDSHSIASFAIDEAAPALRLASLTSVPSPVCLLFAP